MQNHLQIALQQFFGFPELQKIDPNTQEVIDNGTVVNSSKFSQAIIPSVVIGLSKFLHTEQGWRSYQGGENYPNWGSRIFGRHNIELCKRITEYSEMRWEEVMHKMHEVIERAVWIIRSEGLKTDVEVKEYAEAEKQFSLIYLPATLKLGEMLGDDTIDDRTHKMEGPISNFVKSIGNSFEASEKKTSGDLRNFY